MRVIIACGGTGGHLFPGIAVAEELQIRGHEVLALISEKKVDATAIAAHPHIPHATLPSIATPRLLSPRMVPFAARLIGGIRASRKRIKAFQPDVFLGMGGFTSFPGLVAARMLGVRTLLHESNAFPGRANRLGSRFADLVLLGFADCADHFPRAETRCVGTPVRSALLSGANPVAAHKELELDPAARTILVIGGSQGARGLNHRILDALPDLTEIEGRRPQVLHLAGAGEHESVAARYAESGDAAPPHRVLPFCHHMQAAYAVADLVVARSGASTLNELAVLGLPAILVPYPAAADRHQHRNAEVFVNAGAAVLADEEEVDGPGLARLINGILSDPEKLEALSDGMKSLSPLAAASRIADAIEEGDEPVPTPILPEAVPT